MAPRRKQTAAPEVAAPSVSLSPRRTRSGVVGKRVAPPNAVAPAKSKKKSRVENTATATATAAATGEKKKGKEKEKEKGEKESGAKSIVVEACKQCNAFKTRALKVKEGIEAALPAVSVTINPHKPRRGCFEIREQDGEIFLSLLDMPRPFTPMKKLDMDELIQDIISKIG